MATTGHVTQSVYSRYAITDEAMLKESMEKFLAWRETEASVDTHKTLTIASFVGSGKGGKALNSLVPGAGLEPACPYGRRILSPLRLPFRHPG